MDIRFKEKFTTLWKRHFNDAELPITFYYTDEEGHAPTAEPESAPRCIVFALAGIRKGNSLSFDAESVRCFGGKRYLGFSDKVMPDFEYFLSCGIPSRLKGERYKKSPELVQESTKYVPEFKAPAKFIVFKRWDMLEESDSPEVIIFFAEPDVLSGLCTLASFDEAEPNSVIAPHGSGCSTIVLYPYLEKDSSRPRGVIGMFDPSARPYVPKNTLTFSVPVNRFFRLVDNMDESFLITDTWRKIQKRIGQEPKREAKT